MAGTSVRTVNAIKTANRIAQASSFMTVGNVAGGSKLLSTAVKGMARQSLIGRLVKAEPVIRTVGTAFKTLGQIKAGFDAARAEKYNAKVLEVASKDALARGRLTEYLLRRQSEKLLAKQRALYAKAGVLLEGSPLEVMADSLANYEMEMALRKYEAEALSRRYASEAQYKRYLARKQKESALFGAGKTLLTTSERFLEKYWRVG